MRSVLLRALAVLGGAALLLLLLCRNEGTMLCDGGPADARGADRAAASATPDCDATDDGRAADRATSGADARDADAAREPVATGAGNALLRCRLDGLHPDAPWTATVRVQLIAHDLAAHRWRTLDEHRAPDADGVVALALPPWVADAEQLTFEFSAIDPLYKPFTVSTDAGHFADSLLAGPEPFALRVQAVAVVHGRVADGDGKPVADAEVTAGPNESEVRGWPQLASTKTDEAGRYRLALPFAGEVRLVAADRRGDLVPAAAASVVQFGDHEFAPLVLRPRGLVTGVLVDADGQPCAGCVVSLADDPPVAAPVAGCASCSDSCTTAADGRFRLRGEPGRLARVCFTPSPFAPLVGEFVRRVRPPADVVLVLEVRRMHVDVRADGRPVEATVDSDDYRAIGGCRRTDARGAIDLQLASGTACTLIVSAAGRAVWRRTFAAGETVPPTLVVELAPAPKLHTMTIALDGAPLPRYVRCQLQPRDADGAAPGTDFDPYVRDVLEVRDGRVRLPVPSGRQRMTLGAAAFDGVGRYLLTSEHELAIADADVELHVPCAYGGRLAIDVTDAHCVRPPGRARFARSPRGAFAPAFAGVSGDAAPGTLRTAAISETADVLPPGVYEVELDLGTGGVHRRTVAIRACETTKLRLSLP
jgi:hypothetical protein